MRASCRTDMRGFRLGPEGCGCRESIGSPHAALPAEAGGHVEEGDAMTLVRGDSWTIALPEGWKAPETLANGTVYIDSFDESKGIYVTTWMLAPEDAPASPAAAAESFKNKD